jgi:hypothetical protein
VHLDHPVYHSWQIWTAILDEHHLENTLLKIAKLVDILITSVSTAEQNAASVPSEWLKLTLETPRVTKGFMHWLLSASTKTLLAFLKLTGE